MVLAVTFGAWAWVFELESELSPPLCSCENKALKTWSSEKSQASVLSASEYEYAEMMVIRIPLSVVQSVNKPAGLQSYKVAKVLRSFGAQVSRNFKHLLKTSYSVKDV